MEFSGGIPAPGVRTSIVSQDSQEGATASPWLAHWVQGKIGVDSAIDADVKRQGVQVTYWHSGYTQDSISMGIQKPIDMMHPEEDFTQISETKINQQRIPVIFTERESVPDGAGGTTVRTSDRTLLFDIKDERFLPNILKSGQWKTFFFGSAPVPVSEQIKTFYEAECKKLREKEGLYITEQQKSDETQKTRRVK